jgi:hypothetical protein
MPTFCRHNRLVQNCPICAREQAIELRPIVSSSQPRTSQPRTSAGTPSSRTRAGDGRSGAGAGVRVRRLARGVDDGYHSSLVPGLKSSSDAERLAEELAFAARRLTRLAEDPPGLYAEVADPGGDLEERTWLAFLIAYLCPLDEEDPFSAIRQVRTHWTGELPVLDEVRTGPRTAHEPGTGTRTLEAYRAWAARSGTQAAAFTGDQSWMPERRFERIFERLALPGLQRDARFDLLATLGRLGVYDVRAGALQFGGDNQTTVAAKRILGIGDPLLLERRAAELARACEVPLEALDLAFFNWEAHPPAPPPAHPPAHPAGGERATVGLGLGAEPDDAALASATDALGL